MVKVRQKISGTFRTRKGADDFVTLRSVSITAQKQGWNVFETLAHPEPMLLLPQLRVE